MKANAHRSIEAVVLLLGGLGAVSSAPAEVINGTLGLDPSLPSLDKYELLCPTGTSRVEGRVEDLPPSGPALVSFSINDDVGTASVTDPTDGNGLSSTSAILSGGPGNYELLVDKTPGNAENYQVVVFCIRIDRTGRSVLPGNIVQIQDESGGPRGAPLVPGEARVIDGTLAGPTGSTDRFDVLCSPQLLNFAEASVEDLPPSAPALVGLKINDVDAAIAIDSTDGDGIASRVILPYVRGNGGHYELLVTKIGLGDENYRVVVNCGGALATIIGNQDQ